MFSPPTREWFGETFARPTPAQEGGWRAIAAGSDTLIAAPTGSGKTLAAFLWAIDRLGSEPTPDLSERCRVLYVSPLKALAVDVEKNLTVPLRGVTERAGDGYRFDQIRVGVRSGDTPASERRRLVARPPDILITTPESLYLMLTSRARQTLRSVRWVIVDEIHAVASTKRGSHLALSLERLEEVARTRPVRIGLSATQRPLEVTSRLLSGHDDSGSPRPVTLVETGESRRLDIRVEVPVDDMAELPADPREEGTPAHDRPGSSIWPSIQPRLLELVMSHRSTLIFVNARRLAERLASRLNELHAQMPNRGDQYEGWSGEGVELVGAHHGSLSRARRLEMEDRLKSGRLRGLVATSSLELGIDMGEVDLVVQVESPGSVSSAIQRIGRAGHGVGEVSSGRIFPKHRSDLLETAVVAERAMEGRIEETRYPLNPLDVLAQQVVAMVAVEDWDTGDLLRVIRRAAPFRELTEVGLEAVLEMLAGHYPADEFSGLRARVVWDRAGGRVRTRRGAGRVAVTNPGTIPDRGLFGVFLPDGKRVGELDEEMVHESRVGERFLLGASTWRIEEITHERVVVTPAPGRPGRMPFWHGDGPGRPVELGRAVGEFTRRLMTRLPVDVDGALASGDLDGVIEELGTRNRLEPRAARNLLRFLADQRSSTGAVPDDRTVVVERFTDQLGDWQVCLLSPFGARVHAPWAMAIEARLGDSLGVRPDIVWSDDGIIFRLPGGRDAMPVDELVVEAGELEELLVAHLPSTAMFASRFREVAGRALLLPRHRPGGRSPLWQQRRRAAELLEVASRFPRFPMLVETTRECLTDVFDVNGLSDLLGGIGSGRIRLVVADTERPSPMARSLSFDWTANFIYDGDSPLGERRAVALTLDPELLADLMGVEELRGLLDPGVLAETEERLQRRHPDWRARDADELVDLLVELGPLTVAEMAERSVHPLADHLDDLVGSGRVVRVNEAGEQRLAAAVDRELHGESKEGPGTDARLVRYSRTHGPFTAAEAAGRLGLSTAEVTAALEDLVSRGRMTTGAFRPGGESTEWVGTHVLRTLRRRSLEILRREVEPVEHRALARFAVAWQGLDDPSPGPPALEAVIERLEGRPLPVASLESLILPARVSGYRPSDLDSLVSSGRVVWTGCGGGRSRDARVVFHFRDSPVPPPGSRNRPAPRSRTGSEAEVGERIRRFLESHGASFWPDIRSASGAVEESEAIDALWDLVWRGALTNDTLAPLRSLIAGGRGARTAGRRRGSRPRGPTRSGPPEVAGRWSLVRWSPGETSDTEYLHLLARRLVARHGLVTRETLAGEDVPGGFSALYPVLRTMEERGLLRRGYFVEDLGGAQFAAPGAVDLLRRRDSPGAGEVLALAVNDPAQTWGSVVPWPEGAGARVTRRAGSVIVTIGGLPMVLVDPAGRSLVTFPSVRGDTRWAEALVELVAGGHYRSLEVARIDGADARDHPLAEILHDHGFARGYRGPTLR